jgi:DNA-binding PadR family transcriptional regulator
MGRTLTSPSGVEYALLGLLSTGPCHGYELHKQLSQLSGIGLLWNVKQANLYALLEKLERRGLVGSRLAEGVQHAHKKEFSLTPAGQKAFEAWRSAPVRHARDMRQEFLARLYFARFNSPDAVQALILAQEAACQSWLARFDQTLAGLNDDQAYERAVCRFRMEQVRAMLTWLAEQEANPIPTLPTA